MNGSAENGKQVPTVTHPVAKTFLFALAWLLPGLASSYFRWQSLVPAGQDSIFQNEWLFWIPLLYLFGLFFAAVVVLVSKAAKSPQISATLVAGYFVSVPFVYFFWALATGSDNVRPDYMFFVIQMLGPAAIFYTVCLSVWGFIGWLAHRARSGRSTGAQPSP